MRNGIDIKPSNASCGRFAVIIPVYNHQLTIAEVVRQSLELDIPVFVVDDGSTDSTFERVKEIKGAHVMRHPFNRGKGAALMTGMKAASKVADWAITLDADGQHRPSDAGNLIRAIPENERPIIVGYREGMLAAKAPWTSRFGREFSNFWVRASGGPGIADSQSGFRIYPLPECLDLGVKTRRFQFEIEILVKAEWSQIPVVQAPVGVSYHPGMPRISHFHPFYDFLRNFGLFSRLISYRVFGLAQK